MRGNEICKDGLETHFIIVFVSRHLQGGTGD
jgi:hypothetical protein